MLKKSVLLLLNLAIMAGQTLVDLRTQSQNIDFTAAIVTKPFKAGTALLPTCALGEVFLKTNVAAGANLYACVAANTWVVQNGGGDVSAPVTVQNGGLLVGQRGTLNFVAGDAFLSVATDTGTRINVLNSVDTAVVETQAVAQSGSAQICASASASSSSYTCAMTPTLRQLSANMVLRWRPDVAGAGGATTLDIDTLGAKSILLADGVANPTAEDIIAGRLYDIWYDGAVFRLQTPPVLLGSAISRPACDATRRGRLWQTFGTTGVQDTVAVCAKDGANTYAWRTIY